MPTLALALLLAAAQVTPSAAVKEANDRVRADITAYLKASGKPREKARAKARAAVGELIDFETLSRATLGKKWDELKAADRKRYETALRSAMEANYLSKMEKGKPGDAEKVKTEILSEEKQGENTLVKTKVTSGDDSASIDYLMAKQAKGYRAVDVITESVSLAETYREQVGKLLAKKGLDGVIAALEKKRRALEAGSAGSAGAAPAGEAKPAQTK